MAGEPDGRARQGQATRERVFQAAVEVFVMRGYDNATMAEIATEAGVARRTAFNHFPAKADIAVEWAVRRGEHAFALVRHAPRTAQSVPDRVRAFFHELAVMTERDWEETRQLTTGWLRGFGAPNHRSWLSGELRDWLQEWLSERQAPADATLVTEILFDVFQGALLRWMPRQPPGPGQFTAEVDAAIALVLAGLGHEAGRA